MAKVKMEFGEAAGSKSESALESTSQVWTFGKPEEEWQVTLMDGEVHIFYAPDEVKKFLKSVDISTAFDSNNPQGAIQISIRKVTRHGGQTIRFNTAFRVAETGGGGAGGVETPAVGVGGGGGGSSWETHAAGVSSGPLPRVEMPKEAWVVEKGKKGLYKARFVGKKGKKGKRR